MVELITESPTKITMRIFFVVFIIMLFQSCIVTNVTNDDKRVKEYFNIYRRIGDFGPPVYRNYIIIKKNHMTYEQYSEAGSSVIGKYALNNDTITMFHEYELLFSDTIISIKKMNSNDSVSEFYPQKFLIRNDSLIDITNYSIDPMFSNIYNRPRENYILVK